MGSKNSRDITHKSTDDQAISTNNFDTIMNTDLLSKQESEKEKSSISYSITTEKTTKETTNITNFNETIPFLFQWKKNANKVYITGDFLDNWKSLVEMTKNPKTGFFEYLFYLNRQIYQFKFIVDGNWFYSDNYDIFKDNSNNINNILDTRNININNLLNESNNISIPPSLQQSSIITTTKKKNLFSCVYPTPDELNSTAREMPIHYKSKFITNINKLNNNENCSYKTIEVCPHEKLLHLCYNNIKNELNDKYNKVSVSVRIQHKFLTIDYYRPKKG